MSPDSARVGYVLKVYPRFSETFIVNEILAHEAAGMPLEIFSLRLPVEGRFHAALADVRSPVTYLSAAPSKAASVWQALQDARAALPGVDVLAELAGADVRDALQALELATLVQARGISHLHAHFGSVATTVARLASLLTGVPYTFTAHAKDIFHMEVEPHDLRVKLDAAAATITVSDYNERHLKELFGRSADRVRRVYNGLDLSQFAYSEPARRPPLVAAVGRLIEKKGFDVLIDACALLRAQGKSVRCVIAGGGVLEEQLREQITALGVSDTVELAGPLPQHDVQALVSSAAVVAVPSVTASDGNREGLPTVVLEAMALGTPCVATNETGIPEAVQHGHTGLLVGQRDPRALAEAIGQLLDDAALRRRLACSARRLIEQDFDIARNSAHIRAVFGKGPLAGVA